MEKRMLQRDNIRYDHWPIWKVLSVTCLMIGVFFVVGYIVFGILFIPLMWLITGKLQTVFHSHHLQLAIFGSFAFVNFIWVKYFERRSIVSLGFFKGKIWKELIKGWAFGMMLFVISLSLTYLLGGMTFVKVDFSLATIGYVLSTVPFWFIQGGTEELLTRGWLLPILAKKINLPVAVGISSSLFGILHLGNNHVTVFSMLSIILAGVLMALYMLKTDNIWGVAALHGAWNFTQGNFLGITVSGQSAGASLFHFTERKDSPEWISGGAFGTEGSLLTSIVLLIGILYLLRELSKEGKK